MPLFSSPRRSLFRAVSDSCERMVSLTPFEYVVDSSHSRRLLFPSWVPCPVFSSSCLFLALSLFFQPVAFPFFLFSQTLSHVRFPSTKLVLKYVRQERNNFLERSLTFAWLPAFPRVFLSPPEGVPFASGSLLPHSPDWYESTSP